MFIVWGTTHAGKTDEVPGLFHVVTQFGHVYYLPLIPTGSYVVLEKIQDGGFNGAPISLSFKSWLIAWLRAGSILMMIAAVIGGIIVYADQHRMPPFLPWLAVAALAMAGGALLYLSYKLKVFTHATYERAVQLARHVGLSDMGMLMIEVAYGRLTAAQADAELAKLDQKQLEEQGPGNRETGTGKREMGNGERSFSS